MCEARGALTSGAPVQAVEPLSLPSTAGRTAGTVNLRRRMENMEADAHAKGTRTGMK